MTSNRPPESDCRWTAGCHLAGARARGPAATSPHLSPEVLSLRAPPTLRSRRRQCHCASRAGFIRTTDLRGGDLVTINAGTKNASSRAGVLRPRLRLTAGRPSPRRAATIATTLIRVYAWTTTCPWRRSRTHRTHRDRDYLDRSSCLSSRRSPGSSEAAARSLRQGARCTDRRTSFGKAITSSSTAAATTASRSARSSCSTGQKQSRTYSSRSARRRHRGAVRDVHGAGDGVARRDRVRDYVA